MFDRDVQPVINTNIPGKRPIELVAYYPEFLGYYENCELETKRWCVENIKDDWVILDCGANIGYYTILFSQQASRGHVYAIEPTSTVEMLQKNLDHNKVNNVTICPVALGNRTGVFRDGVFRTWGQEAEVAEYPFLTIDDLVDRYGITRLDFIKIDVDSYDFEVLQGAEQTLARFNPWVVVELGQSMHVRKDTINEALRWLATRGYNQACVLDGENHLVKRRRNPLWKWKSHAQIELNWGPLNRWWSCLVPSRIVRRYNRQQILQSLQINSYAETSERNILDHANGSMLLKPTHEKDHIAFPIDKLSFNCRPRGHSLRFSCIFDRVHFGEGPLKIQIQDAKCNTLEEKDVPIPINDRDRLTVTFDVWVNDETINMRFVFSTLVGRTARLPDKIMVYEQL